MTDMAIYLLGVVMGSWLIFDGAHVLAKGKYFGPPDPGPWADVVRAIGVNPFSLGGPFILLGCLWLVSIYALFSQQPWSSVFSGGVAILSMWYLPVGTVISAIFLVLLWLH